MTKFYHDGFDERRIKAAAERLPRDPSRVTDKYFSRTRTILRQRKWNPWVQAQVFIRKGPGIVAGIYDALAVFTQYTDFLKNGGRVWALEEGADYEGGEMQMRIEGFLDDFVELETIYIGLLSGASSQVNDGERYVDLGGVTNQMRVINAATRHPVYARNGRPVLYFGARHKPWWMDRVIANATFDGNAIACSTDVGANSELDEAEGTIPHALQCASALYVGRNNAVVESIKAFDEVIDPRVKRIVLADYNNREVSDSNDSALALDGRLAAVRLDTHGGMVAEGAVPSHDSAEAEAWRKAGLYLPPPLDPVAKYWYGPGVTITSAFAVRQAAVKAGHDYGTILTSGFGDPAKVRAFVDAEHILETQLFHGLGAGELFGGRFATMDITKGAKDPSQPFEDIHKVGRPPVDNPRLKPALGTFN